MTKDALNPDLIEIEQLTRKFADAHAALSREAEDLEGEIALLKRQRLSRLRALTRRTATARADLVAAIGERPHAFTRPKTREYFGIRVGFRKQKGTISFRDGEALAVKIEKQLPDQAEQLVSVKKTPIKSALQQLPAAILRRLGVTLTDDTDEPFVKTQDGDVLKLVEGWLKDAEETS